MDIVDEQLMVIGDWIESQWDVPAKVLNALDFLMKRRMKLHQYNKKNGIKNSHSLSVKEKKLGRLSDQIYKNLEELAA